MIFNVAVWVEERSLKVWGTLWCFIYTCVCVSVRGNTNRTGPAEENLTGTLRSCVRFLGLPPPRSRGAPAERSCYCPGRRHSSPPPPPRPRLFVSSHGAPLFSSILTNGCWRGRAADTRAEEHRGEGRAAAGSGSRAPGRDPGGAPRRRGAKLWRSRGSGAPPSNHSHNRDTTKTQ